MSEGDVAIAALPQADGQMKNRPIVILRAVPPFDDFLVGAISTQLHLRVANLDELMLGNDPDFPASGLKKPSLIRLGCLATLPPASVLGRIGSLSPARHQKLLTQLAHFLSP